MLNASTPLLGSSSSSLFSRYTHTQSGKAAVLLGALTMVLMVATVATIAVGLALGGFALVASGGALLALGSLTLLCALMCHHAAQKSMPDLEPESAQTRGIIKTQKHKNTRGKIYFSDEVTVKEGVLFTSEIEEIIDNQKRKLEEEEKAKAELEQQLTEEDEEAEIQAMIEASRTVAGWSCVRGKLTTCFEALTILTTEMLETENPLPKDTDRDRLSEELKEKLQIRAELKTQSPQQSIDSTLKDLEKLCQGEYRTSGGKPATPLSQEELTETQELISIIKEQHEEIISRTKAASKKSWFSR